MEDSEDVLAPVDPAQSRRPDDRSHFDSALFSIRFHTAVSASATGAKPSNGSGSEIPYAIALPDAGIKSCERRLQGDDG
jgi:hypothetical protein